MCGGSWSGQGDEGRPHSPLVTWSTEFRLVPVGHQPPHPLGQRPASNTQGRPNFLVSVCCDDGDGGGRLSGVRARVLTFALLLLPPSLASPRPRSFVPSAGPTSSYPPLVNSLLVSPARPTSSDRNHPSHPPVLAVCRASSPLASAAARLPWHPPSRCLAPLSLELPFRTRNKSSPLRSSPPSQRTETESVSALPSHPAPAPRSARARATESSMGRRSHRWPRLDLPRQSRTFERPRGHPAKHIHPIPVIRSLCLGAVLTLLFLALFPP